MSLVHENIAKGYTKYKTGGRERTVYTSYGVEIVVIEIVSGEATKKKKSGCKCSVLEHETCSLMFLRLWVAI